VLRVTIEDTDTGMEMIVIEDLGMRDASGCNIYDAKIFSKPSDWIHGARPLGRIHHFHAEGTKMLATRALNAAISRSRAVDEGVEPSTGQDPALD
jgi:hypothetical protein